MKSNESYLPGFSEKGSGFMALPTFKKKQILKIAVLHFLNTTAVSRERNSLTYPNGKVVTFETCVSVSNFVTFRTNLKVS